jgi:hypothetical protein
MRSAGKPCDTRRCREARHVVGIWHRERRGHLREGAGGRPSLCVMYRETVRSWGSRIGCWHLGPRPRGEGGGRRGRRHVRACWALRVEAVAGCAGVEVRGGRLVHERWCMRMAHARGCRGVCVVHSAGVTGACVAWRPRAWHTSGC